MNAIPAVARVERLAMVVWPLRRWVVNPAGGVPHGCGRRLQSTASAGRRRGRAGLWESRQTIPPVDKHRSPATLVSAAKRGSSQGLAIDMIAGRRNSL